MFGWHGRHVLNRDKLMLSLEKVFRGHDMEKMAQGLWQRVLQPESIADMHPGGCEVHFSVMQCLGDEAVVYYYTLEREDIDIRVRAFVLVMRLNLGPSGYMIIYRMLDPKTYLQEDVDTTAMLRPGPSKVKPYKENAWLNAFVWTVCEYTGEQNNEWQYTYGGEIESTALTSAGWWHLAMFQAALNFETKVLGSRGLLLF